MTVDDSCNCGDENDSCKEVFLAAYKCYLKNKDSPDRCLPEIKQMRECYENTSFLQRLKQKVYQRLSWLTK
ncbi:hypothetical protein NEOKW01_2069 [Nematocida sp. AWRm80]|nr:hypothetical protein NEOKW01_2069 [Nematocida sp. AWRm80]